MKTTLKVSGMTCQNCVKHVREALESLEGISNVHVDLGAGQASFEGSGAEAAIAAITEEGYEASLA
jgi:copper chaperone